MKLFAYFLGLAACLTTLVASQRIYYENGYPPSPARNNALFGKARSINRHVRLQKMNSNDGQVLHVQANEDIDTDANSNDDEDDEIDDNNGHQLHQQKTNDMDMTTRTPISDDEATEQGFNEDKSDEDEHQVTDMPRLSQENDHTMNGDNGKFGLKSRSMNGVNGIKTINRIDSKKKMNGMIKTIDSKDENNQQSKDELMNSLDMLSMDNGRTMRRNGFGIKSLKTNDKKSMNGMKTMMMMNGMMRSINSNGVKIANGNGNGMKMMIKRMNRNGIKIVNGNGMRMMNGMRNGIKSINGNLMRSMNGNGMRMINRESKKYNGMSMVKMMNGRSRKLNGMMKANEMNEIDLDERVTNGIHGNGDDHHHSDNPLDWLRNAINGEPEQDYPIYSTVPSTSFRCNDHQSPGYYADVDARCQVFHICQHDGRMDSFLCPNGTIFSQKVFVCVWWHDFDCETAPQFYSLNDNLYISDTNGFGNEPHKNGDKSMNGGSMNGGSVNGGSMNGGSMNGGSMNGGSMNGGSINGGSMNGGSMNGGSMNGGSMNGGSMNGLSETDGLEVDGPMYGEPMNGEHGSTMNGDSEQGTDDGFEESKDGDGIGIGIGYADDGSIDSKEVVQTQSTLDDGQNEGDEELMLMTKSINNNGASIYRNLRNKHNLRNRNLTRSRYFKRAARKRSYLKRNGLRTNFRARAQFKNITIKKERFNRVK